MQIIQNLLTINQTIIDQIPNGLSFVGIMWIVHAVNFASGYRLLVLGIIPRTPPGLIGILFAPFLHANFDHIFFNSLPLFVLGTFLLTSSMITAVYITVGIVLIGGVLTWALARRAIHVGASGLIMGYMGYLLSECYFNRSPAAWIVGIVSLYYLGSLLFSLIPDDRSVSFEGHIFGFTAGILMSVYHIDLFYSIALFLTPQVYYVFQALQSVF